MPMSKAAAPALLLSVLLLCGVSACELEHPAPSPAENPNSTPPPGGFEPPAGVVVLRHQQVRMRDGARLDADIYLPAASGGPWPVVLIRTPYRTELGRRSEMAQRLLKGGYALMQEHERGRYLSEGSVAMLSRAGEDGWDTLDWIVAQPWADGKVATMGCSSSAENQLKLASLGHPAHKAMIAYSAGVAVGEIGPFQEQGNFWRGGVWQQGWFNYFVSETQKDWPQLPAGLSDDERRRASASFEVDNRNDSIGDSDYDRVRMHLPMMDMGRAIDAPRNDFEEYLARGPAGSAAWHHDRVTDADSIRVPGLWAEALYDISARSTVAFFEKTRQDNPAGSQAIVIANGQHCAYGRETEDQHIGDRPIGDARFDYVGRQIAWLDHWLKGAPLSDAAPKRPVTTYLAGANRWASFDAVPWAGKDPSRSFWLSSAGSANTAAGNGALQDTAPDAVAADRFDYDPANPVIAHGGEISGVGTDQAENDGSFDQRNIESRPDVLVYTSPALDADLPVFGYVTAELFVGSSAPDTDFTVKLVDVAPDGTAWNIADSILRMRYREGTDKAVFMQPDATYRINPPPMLVSNVFLKGHRLRLEVSSSNFPSYARNLNTEADPYTSTAFQVAHNVVHHGPETPSKIVLPVVSLAP